MFEDDTGIRDVSTRAVFARLVDYDAKPKRGRGGAEEGFTGTYWTIDVTDLRDSIAKDVLVGVAVWE